MGRQNLFDMQWKIWNRARFGIFIKGSIPTIRSIGALKCLNQARLLPNSLLVSDHANHKIAFDNWFCSVNLLVYLAKRGIYGVATFRKDRAKSIIFKTDKDLKLSGRSSFDEQNQQKMVWKYEQ